MYIDFLFKLIANYRMYRMTDLDNKQVNYLSVNGPGLPRKFHLRSQCIVMSEDTSFTPHLFK